MNNKTLILNDQKEYNKYLPIIEDWTEKGELLWLNTSPYISTNELSRLIQTSRDKVFGWEDYCSFKSGIFSSEEFQSFEHFEKILLDFGWPESADEMLGICQTKYRKISGRFYQQKFDPQAEIRKFFICRSLLLMILQDHNISRVFTYPSVDMGKMGVMLSALENEIPFFEFEPSNLSGASFVVLCSKEQDRFKREYYGAHDGRPIRFATNTMSRDENRYLSSWSLGASLLENPHGAEEDTNIWNLRQKHHKKFALEDNPGSHVLKRALRRLFLFPINLVRAFQVFYDSYGRYKMLGRHRLVAFWSRLKKLCFFFAIDLRALRNVFMAKIIKQRCSYPHKSTVIALHVFPESTMLGGISWRGIKSEVDLIAHSDIRAALQPNCTVFAEHPVQLVRGERPRSFWGELRRYGYNLFDKYSMGVDVSSKNLERVVSISGTILLEAAFYQVQALAIKNTPLLVIDGVKHISTLRPEIGDFVITIESYPITAEDYIGFVEKNGVSKGKDIQAVIKEFGS